MWTDFVSGTLPNPAGKDPVPLKTLSGAQTLVEEVEFSCTKSFGTYCAINYIEFGSSDAIVNRQNGNCLHINGDGSNPNNYAHVIMSGCNGSNNQKWRFNGLGQIKHTPSGACLDMGTSYLLQNYLSDKKFAKTYPFQMPMPTTWLWCTHAPELCGKIGSAKGIPSSMRNMANACP